MEVHVLVSECAAGLNDQGDEYWDMEVSSPGHQAFRCRLTNPWTRKQDDELYWYLETFATNQGSPFEKARAARCSKALQNYGLLLWSRLQLDSFMLNHNVSQLVINIQASSSTSGVLSLYWEVLEQRQHEQSRVSVCVFRSLQTANRIQQVTRPCTAINILLVVARPKDNDIDPMLVAEQLLSTISSITKKDIQINVEVVRPGTWDAFVSYLNSCTASHGKGYFQIIHLDVHGLTLSKGKRQGVFLTFLHNDGTQAHFKKADIVAKEIRAHDVDLVVLNSCRSASTRSPGIASLAAQFLKEGIPMVVGMTANISSTAVSKFVPSFYSALLEDQLSCAASIARARMLLFTERQRNARFSSIVEVDDWIVPVVYLGIDIAFTITTKESTSDLNLNPWSRVKSLVSTVNKYLFSLNVDPPPKEAPFMLGRGSTILDLENIVSIPFERSGYQNVWRRHVHIVGVAAIGKTLLADYLSWWWTTTGFIKTGIHVDCLAIESRTFNSILRAIASALSPISLAGDPKFSTIMSKLASTRYALFIDHIESLSGREPLFSRSDLAQLNQLLGDAAAGGSLVFTLSRNQNEDWLNIPGGTMFLYTLQGLTPSNAYKLAQHYLQREPRMDVSDEKEISALQALIEQQEHIPAGIQAIINVIKNASVTPSELIDIHVRDIAPDKLLTINLPHCRFIMNFAHIITALKLGEVKHEHYRDLLIGILTLAPFHRRLPPLLEVYQFYRCMDIGDRAALFARFSATEIETILTNSNEKNAQLFKVAIPQIRTKLTPVIDMLSLNHFIWPEKLIMPGGLVEEYWHIHPLFSLALNLAVLNQGHACSAIGDPKPWDIYRFAFAHFYESRILHFNDTNPQEADFSTQRLLLELDNATGAVHTQIRSWIGRHRPSNILLRLSQNFPLNAVTRQNYRQILSVFRDAIDHYNDAAGTISNPIELDIELHNFLVAAGTLQNVYFSTSEWPQVRRYTKLINETLAAYPEWLRSSSYGQAHQAQTNMVIAFELKSSGFITPAYGQFRNNLAQLPAASGVLVDDARSAKLRMMNSLGVVQCALLQDNIQIEELLQLAEQHVTATKTFVNIVSTLPFLKNWLQHGQMLLGTSLAVRDQIEFRRRFEEAGDDELFNIPSFISSQFANMANRISDVQGFFATYPKVMSDKAAWQSPESHRYALLKGLEAAYRADADTVTKASYHGEIVCNAINDKLYDVALEAHIEWCRLQFEVNGEPDDISKCRQDYIYSLCYTGLDNRELAQSYVISATSLAEKHRLDQILLSCMHISTYLYEIEGAFGSALDTICRAGILGYDMTRHAHFSLHGSIVQYICRIMSHVLYIEGYDVRDIMKALSETRIWKSEPDEDRGGEPIILGSKLYSLLLPYARIITNVLGTRGWIAFLRMLGDPGNFIDVQQRVRWRHIEKSLFSREIMTTDTGGAEVHI